MKGRKKGKFYTMCGGDEERFLSEREGWKKDGYGYAKDGFGWEITHLDSGLLITKNTFSTMEEAHKFLIEKEDKIKELMGTKKFSELQKTFNILLKDKENFNEGL